MLAESTSATIAQYASGITVSLVAIAFGIQKLLKNWGSNSAENKVVLLLREELERMSKQNAALATEMNKLQFEVIELNKSLGTLTAENQRLHLEVNSLTQQVDRLHTTLEKEQIK
jgi:predicted nuclease with TOPRIM domain